MNQVPQSHRNAEFIVSAATFKGLPVPKGIEFAILGRSNVGKSSFINHVFSDSKLARTSKMPGKTTLANFYRLNQEIFWVDLPGYGFAKASATEKERWSQLIGNYCEQRKNLVGAIWLLDLRHPGQKADIEAGQWLAKLNRAIFPVLTKSDKLSKNLQHKNAGEYMKLFRFDTEPLLYSIHDNQSRENFWHRFDAWRLKLTAGPQE